MDRYELPQGWVWTKIGDIVSDDGIFCDGDWVESKDQDPDGDVRLIQLADIGDGYYRDKSDRHLTRQKAEELRCTFLEVSDVLIARMPDPLGRACIFPGDKKVSVTVVDVCIVRTGSKGADQRWLMHIVNSPDFRENIESLQSGSTRKRISRGNLATIEFPLPPLAEQQRIVDEIEAQFTRLDAVVAALKRAQTTLKRYRASVLKTACEGRLVPQNPTDEPASQLLERILAERRQRWNGRGPYTDPTPPDTSDLPELPVGWVWARLEQLSKRITDGTHQPPQFVDEGIPFVFVKHVVSGTVSFENTKFISEETYEQLQARCPVEVGDILYTTVGSYGVAAPVPANRRFSFQRHIAHIKPLQLVSQEFLIHCLNSPSGLIEKSFRDRT